MFGIPPKDHTELARSDLKALSLLGYQAREVSYGNNSRRMSFTKKLGGTIYHARRLSEELELFEPDILYLNSRFDLPALFRDVVSLFIVKRNYKKKLSVVIKTHGTDSGFVRAGFLSLARMFMALIDSYVDGWLVLSTEEIAALRETFPRVAGRLHLIPNIVQVPLGCQRDVKPASVSTASPFRILFSGRLILPKGCIEIVEAIGQLPNPRLVELTILGDGPEAAGIKSRIKELGLAQLVQMPGYLSEAEADRFLADAHLLVLPSREEGFSMALFKAVAAGVPVATTRIRAAKDYLIEPDNVIWIEAGNPDSIRRAVQRCIEDPDLRQRMSSENMKLGQRFTPESVGKLLDGALQSVSSDKEGRHEI